MLRNAKARFELAGYQVETIRIATQPFPEYTAGMPKLPRSHFSKISTVSPSRENSSSPSAPRLAEKDDRASATPRGNFEPDQTCPARRRRSKRRRPLAAAFAPPRHEKTRGHTYHSDGNFHFAAIANVPATRLFSRPLITGSRTSVRHRPGIRERSRRRWPRRIQKPRARRLIPNSACSPRQVENVACASTANWMDLLGLDLSPAPMKDASIDRRHRKYSPAAFGTNGTLSAVATITSALKEVGCQDRLFRSDVARTRRPVLAQRWGAGASPWIRCSLFRRMRHRPRHHSSPWQCHQEQLTRIIGDIATLSVKLTNPSPPDCFPSPA